MIIASTLTSLNQCLNCLIRGGRLRIRRGESEVVVSVVLTAWRRRGSIGSMMIMIQEIGETGMEWFTMSKS